MWDKLKSLWSNLPNLLNQLRANLLTLWLQIWPLFQKGYSIPAVMAGITLGYYSHDLIASTLNLLSSIIKLF